MPYSSEIGAPDFYLGNIVLGFNRILVSRSESIVFSDDFGLDGYITFDEVLALAEQFTGTQPHFETIHFEDSARITSLTAPLSAKICYAIQRFGNSVKYNEYSMKAFLKIRITDYRFKDGVTMKPGDAVGYFCQSDLKDIPPKLGDSVLDVNGRSYLVESIEPKWFFDRLAYYKLALRYHTYSKISIPTGLQISARDEYEDVFLTWQDVKNPMFDHYLVYRSEDGGDFIGIGKTQYTNFKDENLDPTLPYDYRVTVIDIYGNESAPSLNVSSPPKPDADEVGEVFIR